VGLSARTESPAIPIRAGLKILPLLFSIMGIDVGHQPPIGPNRVGEILSIRVDIFSAEKDMVGLNVTMPARTVDLAEQILDAVDRILD